MHKMAEDSLIDSRMEPYFKLWKLQKIVSKLTIIKYGKESGFYHKKTVNL